MKYATTVLVQTETAGNRLKKYFGIKSFVVTPNAITLQEATSDQIPANFSPNSTNIYLFCLSHYYPHKNLEIFIPLAKKIKAANLPYRIIVTLAPHQHPEAKHFLKNIEGSRPTVVGPGNLQEKKPPRIVHSEHIVHVLYV